MAVQTQNAKTYVTCHTAEWLFQKQIHLWQNCLLTHTCALHDTCRSPSTHNFFSLWDDFSPWISSLTAPSQSWQQTVTEIYKQTGEKLKPNINSFIHIGRSLLELPTVTAIIIICLLLECPLNCGLFQALDFIAGGVIEQSDFTVDVLVTSGWFLPQCDEYLLMPVIFSYIVITELPPACHYLLIVYKKVGGFYWGHMTRKGALFF